MLPRLGFCKAMDTIYGASVFPRLRSLSVSQCVKSGKEAIVSVEIK